MTAVPMLCVVMFTKYKVPPTPFSGAVKTKFWPPGLLTPMTLLLPVTLMALVIVTCPVPGGEIAPPASVIAP